MERNPQAGFTLIELLAVMIVGGILLSALTGFYLQEQRALRRQQIQIEASQALRVTLEQVVRDLRGAGRNPLSGSDIGFKVANGEEVRFTLDDGLDGLADESQPGEHKGFRRDPDDPSVLQSYVPGTGGATSWYPLAKYLRPPVEAKPLFTYYDSDGIETADLTQIARIDISLTVTSDVPGAPTFERTEVASVQLRNRR